MRFNLFIILIFSVFIGSTQNKITQLANHTFNTTCNDVWGYTDELGNEYAIVGLFNGVSILDITNPNLTNEVYRSSGEDCVWRDLKVFGDYLYVTNEADSGLLIIDLNGLPNSTTLTEKNFNSNNGAIFSKAHNIFIDKKGRGFICGANFGNQGVLIYDLKTDPMNPSLIGTIDDFYVHDVFVIGDTLYTSNIGEGEFMIYDVSNPSLPIVLGKYATKGKFTHNTWTSLSGDYVFTTDEINGGSIGSYDVRDMSNIEYLDGFKKFPNGVEMPHNVTVKDAILFISYYREGFVMVDAQKPNNLIELASFDTDTNLSGANSGGAWGIYPYLPSGKVLISDINNGLFVLEVEIEGGAFLEGEITDASNGFPVFGANVLIDNEIIDEISDLNGSYQTGVNSSVLKSVIYRKTGYISDTIPINFVTNNTVVKDVSLVPLETVTATLQIQALSDLSDFTINLIGDNYEEEFKSDKNGLITIPNIHIGEFEFYVGKWGYESICFTDSISTLNHSYTVTLTDGYNEDFSVNTGWEAIGSNNKTVLERTMPLASFNNSNVQFDPGNDGDEADCGSYAFCTGINPFVKPESSTANKKNYLVSPPINGLDNQEVFYNYWLAFQNSSNDIIKVGIIVGTDTIYFDEFDASSNQRSWEKGHFVLSDKLVSVEDFRIVFFIEDQEPWSMVDAAFDNVRIINGLSSQKELILCQYYLKNNRLKNDCDLTQYFSVIDINGRLIKSKVKELDFSSLPRGVYLIKNDNNHIRKIIW